MRKPNYTLLEPEIEFTTARSSGPGGQNVNKVESKVILKFDVSGSRILSQEEKEIIGKKLLHLSAQEDRSQFKNKQLAIQKFDALLAKAFTVKKKRRPTKATKSSKERRLTDKKRKAEKKNWRGSSGF